MVGQKEEAPPTIFLHRAADHGNIARPRKHDNIFSSPPQAPAIEACSLVSRGVGTQLHAPRLGPRRPKSTIQRWYSCVCVSEREQGGCLLSVCGQCRAWLQMCEVGATSDFSAVSTAQIVSAVGAEPAPEPRSEPGPGSGRGAVTRRLWAEASASHDGVAEKGGAEEPVRRKCAPDVIVASGPPATSRR